MRISTSNDNREVKVSLNVKQKRDLLNKDFAAYIMVKNVKVIM